MDSTIPNQATTRRRSHRLSLSADFVEPRACPHWMRHLASALTRITGSPIFPDPFLVWGGTQWNSVSSVRRSHRFSKRKGFGCDPLAPRLMHGFRSSGDATSEPEFLKALPFPRGRTTELPPLLEKFFERSWIPSPTSTPTREGPFPQSIGSPIRCVPASRGSPRGRPQRALGASWNGRESGFQRA